MKINVCKEYTDTPGGRYKEQGDFSGQDFRETMLEPKYLEADRKSVV